MTARSAAVLLLGLPATALAHSPVEGINSFYNGVLHPALVPAHLLSLLALGLLIGQLGPGKAQTAILAFLTATVAGLTAAVFTPEGNMENALLINATLLGLLVAIGRSLPIRWYVVIAAITGMVIGLDSAQDELAREEALVALFGSGIGIYLLFLYPMGLADYFNAQPWQRIGVRVIGSWVAASAILVLSLSFAPPNQ